MDINGVKVGGLFVVKHSVKSVDGFPVIVIEKISVVDESGKHIKFANLQKITPFLAKLPISFAVGSLAQPPDQKDGNFVQWQVDNNVERVQGNLSEKAKNAVFLLQKIIK